MKSVSYSIIQLFSCSVILLFTSCTNHGAVMKGTLPDERFDDEWVYWVPYRGASAETVDSGRISRDAFRIVISDHNRNKIGIVRVRPQLRFALQDILVYTEAGTVQVKLDSVSSAKGTPLNDVLQNWKVRKRTYDMEVSNLRRKRRVADADEAPEILKEIENASAAYHNDIYKIVVENKDNDVGKFIFSLHKSRFTAEQIEEMDFSK